MRTVSAPVFLKLTTSPMAVVAAACPPATVIIVIASKGIERIAMSTRYYVASMSSVVGVNYTHYCTLLLIASTVFPIAVRFQRHHA